MPGYNAQTYLQGFISAANLREMNRTSSDSISDTEIFLRLNDGINFVAEQYKPTRVRRTADLVTDEQIVRFPVGRMNMSITELMVIREDNTQYPLVRITEDLLEQMYPVADTSRDQGEPIYWCFTNSPSGNRTEFNTVRIRPVPKWSKTDGVIFRFPAFPSQLHRIDNTASLFAHVTQQSASVYIYASGDGSPTTQCRFGDEFGVCQSTNTDGSAVTDATVRVWYGIMESNLPVGTIGNLVTNGTFTGGATGWTLAGGAAYNSDNVTFTGAGTLTQAISSAVNNDYYRVDYTLSAASSPSLTVTYNGVTIDTATADGSYYCYFLSDVAGGDLVFSNASGDVTIDTVTMKAVTYFELDRVFTEPTNTAARFIAAQVPDPEYSVPAGVGYAPMHWALGEYFDDMNQPGKALRFRQKALERIARFNVDEVNDHDDTYDPYAGMERVKQGTTIPWWGYNNDGYIPYNQRGIGRGYPWD